jgi:hypothetical protein
MLVFLWYFNIKCEICVSNRTESREHLKNSTIHVYIGALNVEIKLIILIEMRHEI